MAPRAVYIHIPFCTNKCFYCDFNSYVVKGQPVEAYLAALEEEMARTVSEQPPGQVRTIFVGGGTPTVLSAPQLEQFLQAVRRYFPKGSEPLEFTVEANPGTTDLDKLRVLKEGGVNRISFGAQSFDAHLLRRIGRIHQPEDIYRGVENARKAGFSNLSLDLMFGLPEQTADLFRDTLARALALDLPHYSIYSLIVEENTLFHTLYQKDELPLPAEEEELDMYLTAIRVMQEAGRKQYEISNFARPGFESRHNVTYWMNEEYYGLGAGAHGLVDGVRHENVRGIAEYIACVKQGVLPVKERHEVGRQESMEDMMMVGLRLLDGVSRERFRRRYGMELEEVFPCVISDQVKKGMLAADGRGVRLSRRGLLYGNEVFAAFLG